MPAFCAVIYCGSRGNRDEGIKFFRFPIISGYKALAEITKKRQDAWLTALKRKDIRVNQYKYLTVCSRHFISGKKLLYLHILKVR